MESIQISLYLITYHKLLWTVIKLCFNWCTKKLYPFGISWTKVIIILFNRNLTNNLITLQISDKFCALQHSVLQKSKLIIIPLFVLPKTRNLMPEFPHYSHLMMCPRLQCQVRETVTSTMLLSMPFVFITLKRSKTRLLRNHS